ncbi:MAG: G5 domain-containing protein [Clostridia bacterium]|nr:G5 domain-containing protein [Clostridia bacterium]
MYSQHSSEKPVPTNTNNFSHQKAKLISKFSLLFRTPDNKRLSQPFKSVIATMLTIIMFIGCVIGAYCFEDSMHVGFKPDFQNNQKSYASRNTLFSDGTDVTMTIRVHGEEAIEVTSPVKTVGELLNSYNVSIGNNDVLNYTEETEIFSGMELTVDEIVVETFTQTTEIPFTSITRDSQTVPKGSTKVVQKGVNGSYTETVTQTFKNGVLTDTSTVTNEDSFVEPTDEITETGIGGTYTDINGISYEYSYYMDVTATAYGTLSGYTATGKPVDFGMIAVDPSVIPLGTKVYLTGSTYGDMGVHTAEDTGAGIYGNKIDVFLGDDYDTLMQFGRRTMRIYILL